MKGVDISHYQKGLPIKQLKGAGNDFVIIKLTESSYMIDGSAFTFYHEAYELGFPVGCYCYSHAVTPEQARREAEFLLKTINGFPMPCGIFLDVEEPKMLGLKYEQLMSVLLAWCAAITDAGYVPGVYGSEYNLWAKVSPEDLPTDTLVWVANYGRQSDVACDLWQSSDSGSIPGYSGNVDTDEVRSAWFESLVLRGFKKQEPDKPPDADHFAEARNMPDITGALGLLAEYLKTEGFAAGFKKYIEEALKK